MFTTSQPLALIGCGNMGQALAAGWCHSHLSPDALIVLDRNPDKRRAFYDATQIRHVPSMARLAEQTPAAICLGVKPYQLDEVLAEVKTHFAAQHLSPPLMLSVAAGKELFYYESALWEKAAIIRIMPNTPSQVGEGRSGLVANTHVQADQRKAITQLMQAVGECLWLEDENQMHALTGVSGSGSAYIFYLIEALVSAGLKQGFDEKQARLLAEQTFYGAAKMAKESDLDLTTLRANVTSPNGTTQAGLETLMSSDVKDVIEQTVESARARSVELSST